MDSEEQLRRVELTIDDAKRYINRRKALDRLYENKDFQDVFLNHYFVDEASRLVHLKSDPNMMDKEKQKHLDNLIIGIGCLRQYLNSINTMANMSENALKEHERTREEILQEQMNETDVISTGVQ